MEPPDDYEVLVEAEDVEAEDTDPLPDGQPAGGKLTRGETYAIDKPLGEATESFLRINSFMANFLFGSCCSVVLYTKLVLEPASPSAGSAGKRDACLLAYQGFVGLLFLMGCFFAFGEAPLRSCETWLNTVEWLTPCLDAAGGIRQISSTLLILGEGFVFLSLLFMTQISADVFDINDAFLTTDKIPVMGMLGYSIRSELIHIAWTITLLHANTKDALKEGTWHLEKIGFRAAEHLDMATTQGILYRILLFFGPATCLFLAVQQAVNLLSKSDYPDRLPLPPHVAPSDAIVVWMFAYAFERTYTRCFLVKNVRENENDAAKNRARYLSGVVTLAILIGSSARWILGIFTSTDDIDKLRTQQLWWFLQGVILANTIREVILGSVILFLTGHLQAKDRVGFAVSAVLQLLIWIGAGSTALYGSTIIYDSVVGRFGCAP
jgi:hypothetical protein